MKILNNVRSKIWACVSVALLSYLVATLSTTWVNSKTKASIIHVQQVDLPLSTKGFLVQSLFNTQSEEYENGLLTGEQSEIRQATELHEEIAQLLDDLVKLAGDSHTDFYSQILSLRDDYHDYFILASQYYMQAVLMEDIFAARKEIHQLGKMRGRLDGQFAQVADNLQEMVVIDLVGNNERIDFYTRLQQILFVFFLIVTTVVINWLANKEIIAPLVKIKEMISAFSCGRNVEKPSGNHRGDEIQDLALSFWEMTRDLHHITVSRDYVDNIISNMSDSLIILSPDFSIQTVNQATLELLNVTVDELTGRSFRDVFRLEEERIASSLFQGLLEGTAVKNLESYYLNGEDQPIPILFSASALYLPDGTLQGISCLAREISELQEQREQLEFLANFDKLTGLPNRNLFFDRLSLTVNEARRYGHVFALLYLDLDKFKPLNDQYGHEAGDLALQEVARRLLQTVRDSDTVSRVGGDEFVILLSRVHDVSDAVDVATKILDSLGKPFVILGNQCSLGVSIGICLSSPELTDADKILKNADTAMYAAKAQGRNCFMVSSVD